ncbi:alpha/beta hydrolase fold domain-containing protein [Streptomyces sp. NPDC019990]|uniref:alpha/beta hydrolase fold domain-containing protein n=1 Tax=Streptomyces sp. NPDC019990 TaxID=3154693 RepID=UPI0033EC3880
MPERSPSRLSARSRYGPDIPADAGIRRFIAPSPALLSLHGGGYVMGTAAVDDAPCRRFADELGVLVASVNYRLAPEHPFPTPSDDCTGRSPGGRDARTSTLRAWPSVERVRARDSQTAVRPWMTAVPEPSTTPYRAAAGWNTTHSPKPGAKDLGTCGG